MPALFIFLFKVNIALVLFCLGYYLVLRHLTFYTLNRIYLVIAILFSTLYPNINLSGFAQNHQQFTEPVQNVILNWKAPAENFVKPLYQPNYWQWVELIFWAGVILFAARLMMQLFSLYKLYRQSKPGQVHDHTVRLIRDDISPFSFWRSIYINPTKLSPADLKNVLEHEQVHVNEWHTLDILLAELSTIFYWFNPGVWLMKKAVRENIEFITDRKILQKGTDSKQYQYSLVSVSLATASNTIVNHFNISTIKKRIIMMNAKRSSGYNLTRYVFLVPAVVALLLVFSLSKAATKKGLHTFKAIAADITNITLLNDKPHINNAKPHIAVAKEKTQKPTTEKLTIKTADTLYAGKSKDGKKTVLFTSEHGLDSTTYMINGVPATRADVKALDPGKIISLDLLDAKNAKEFYQGSADLKSRVLFITTNDSETGKKIKEKIDKSFRSGTIARAYNITSDTGKNSSDYARVAASTNVSVSTSTSSESSDDAPVVSSSVSNKASTSVVVLSEPKIATKVKKFDKVFDKVYVTGVPKSTITISGDNDSTHHVYAYNISRDEPAVKAKNMLYLSKVRTNDEATIDNLSNTLFIIDGKGVKGLKNIKSDDIESITILKDESARKLYGDKGKNGVIVIKTKKGK
jgi:bla regulator protein BlaR1